MEDITRPICDLAIPLSDVKNRLLYSTGDVHHSVSGLHVGMTQSREESLDEERRRLHSDGPHGAYHGGRACDQSGSRQSEWLVGG